MRYDLSQGGDGLAVRTLSTLDLQAQVGSDGATWLDRELVSRSRTPLADAGFGRDVADAMERRKQALVDMGHATRLPDGGIRAPADLLSRLERAEVTRVGRAMATERGLTFQQAKTGEYVSGKLIGSTQLASGRFAMIESFSGDGAWDSASCPGSRCSTNGSASTSPGPCATAAGSSGASDANVGWDCEIGHPQ